MARSITFSQAAAAGAFAKQISDVNDDENNPLERTSNVNLYVKSDVAGGRITFKLGNDGHASDAVTPVTAGSLSTNDHLIASGVGLRGQKITVGYRNSGGLPVVLDGMLIIEPIQA